MMKERGCTPTNLYSEFEWQWNKKTEYASTCG